MELDKQNGNNYWMEAIQKEMNAVRVAFEIEGKGDKPPPGYKFVDMMLIMDVKIDFTRRVRLVSRGDQTEPPTSAK